MSLPRQGSYGLAGPNLIGTMSVLECMDEFTLREMGVQSSAQTSTTGRTGIRVESTISYTVVQV